MGNLVVIPTIVWTVPTFPSHHKRQNLHLGRLQRSPHTRLNEKHNAVPESATSQETRSGRYTHVREDELLGAVRRATVTQQNVEHLAQPAERHTDHNKEGIEATCQHEGVQPMRLAHFDSTVHSLFIGPVGGIAAEPIALVEVGAHEVVGRRGDPSFLGRCDGLLVEDMDTEADLAAAHDAGLVGVEQVDGEVRNQAEVAVADQRTEAAEEAQALVFLAGEVRAGDDGAEEDLEVVAGVEELEGLAAEGAVDAGQGGLPGRDAVGFAGGVVDAVSLDEAEVVDSIADLGGELEEGEVVGEFGADALLLLRVSAGPRRRIMVASQHSSPRFGPVF